MGFLIKFLLGFMVVYFLLRSVAAFLIGKRGKQSPNYRQQRTQQTKQPDNQQDRIIEYQKKKFESSDVEDVDFVELKDKKQN
ncbi:hypothetical protein [Proteiniphilum sp.]|uniref:hypothetical protein n=1 Tax=Proteiniphilum sp. TaxID=1926877 RepID=UPI002B217EBF|nr:hypothetical protein [Proteiniphilum sp.]MEA4918595.1 hypothetical protein [Proteiniphilum sp.]